MLIWICKKEEQNNAAQNIDKEGLRIFYGNR